MLLYYIAVTIGFNAPSYSVTEGMGDATVTLTVMSGNITVGEQVVVTVTTQDGSAGETSVMNQAVVPITHTVCLSSLC